MVSTFSLIRCKFARFSQFLARFPYFWSITVNFHQISANSDFSANLTVFCAVICLKNSFILLFNLPHPDAVGRSRRSVGYQGYADQHTSAYNQRAWLASAANARRLHIRCGAGRQNHVHLRDGLHAPGPQPSGAHRQLNLRLHPRLRPGRNGAHFVAAPERGANQCLRSK